MDKLYTYEVFETIKHTYIVKAKNSADAEEKLEDGDYYDESQKTLDSVTEFIKAEEIEEDNEDIK